VNVNGKDLQDFKWEENVVWLEKYVETEFAKHKVVPVDGLVLSFQKKLKEIVNG